MANIRGLNDPEMPNNNQNNNQQIPQGQGPPDDVPFLMGYMEQQEKNPREETFFDFLKYTCCPQFKFKSFTFIISAVQVFVFILSLAISDHIRGEFLQPSNKALIQLGAKYPYLLKQGYIWLLVTPMLLHGNFMHIFSNMISQFIFGTEMEMRLGTFKFIVLYLCSCIGGNLFSCLITDSISVGASSAIFGIIASLLSYMIINWDSLARYGPMRCFVLVMIIIILFFNIMVGMGSKSTIDNYGHLGGFLVGSSISFYLVKPIQANQRTILLQRIGIIFTVCYLVLCTLIFYTTRNPLPMI